MTKQIDTIIDKASREHISGGGEWLDSLYIRNNELLTAFLADVDVARFEHDGATFMPKSGGTWEITHPSFFVRFQGVRGRNGRLTARKSRIKWIAVRPGIPAKGQDYQSCREALNRWLISNS